MVCRYRPVLSDRRRARQRLATDICRLYPNSSDLAIRCMYRVYPQAPAVDDIGPRHGIDRVADIEKNGKDAYVLYKPDGVVER